jgi:hypothetical protein
MGTGLCRLRATASWRPARACGVTPAVTLLRPRCTRRASAAASPCPSQMVASGVRFGTPMITPGHLPTGCALRRHECRPGPHLSRTPFRVWPALTVAAPSPRPAKGWRGAPLAAPTSLISSAQDASERSQRALEAAQAVRRAAMPNGAPPPTSETPALTPPATPRRSIRRPRGATRRTRSG